MGQTAARAEHIRLLTAMARTMVTAGAGADRTARELLRHTDSPISAIKAVADATGMDLSAAKEIVHRNLGAQVRETTETLWRSLERDAEPLADQ